MTWPDYVVLSLYFVLILGIGVRAMRRIRSQEDYLLGSRRFGKLLQTFAAFGAGTGSSDPVNTARTVFVGGASGMWSVMYWLFVTPVYWITAAWYRRMRCLTLGDWFVERYESPRLGAAYALFGVVFYMVYASMLFSAIGKVAAPMIGADAFAWSGSSIGIEYLLVPAVGAVVLAYGVAGGLHAAYLTDVVQGLCIVALSVLLIPSGLSALVDAYGDPDDRVADGFTVLHERLPDDAFRLLGTEGAEFTLPFLAAVVVLNLLGVVVQPHFIATGGGSARSETDARLGLVFGNLLKRLCTVGWLLAALIVLALYGDDPQLVADPDRAWGVASRRLLGPGLSGLMLACLLAALMSSCDVYMVIGAGLIVRNLYVPFVDPAASEQRCLRIARATGALIIVGSVVISLAMMDVFQQLQLTWIVPVLFAAPFWTGMYWRRATPLAAWATVLFGLIVFFVLPRFEPFSSELWMFERVGVDVAEISPAVSGALGLAPKILLPFVVMIAVSLATPPNSRHALDRYYAKMRTTVAVDPADDRKKLAAALEDPSKADYEKLFPGTSLEFSRPTASDVAGVALCFAACLGLVGLAYVVVNLGG